MNLKSYQRAVLFTLFIMRYAADAFISQRTFKSYKKIQKTCSMVIDSKTSHEVSNDNNTSMRMEENNPKMNYRKELAVIALSLGIAANAATFVQPSLALDFEYSILPGKHLFGYLFHNLEID